jgi:DNA helicase-2/ATP-dependent DNA helicase PcrA
MREAIARVDKLSLDGPFGNERIKRMAEMVDQIKNDGMTPSAVAAAGGRFRNRTLPREDVEIMEEYEAAMQADNIVDYNDLILKPLLAFERSPKLAEAWRRQFDAIMIDEYQDTNKTQYMLLRHLAKDKENVLLLGDDDQLIFAWRGADQSYVRDFEEQWPNGEVLNLRINYRNAPAILERAKKMIDLNRDRRVKDMIAHRSNNAVLEMRTFDHQGEEQDYIAHLVKSQIQKGTSLDKIAILTRTKLEATTIALSLASHGIDCFYPDNDILTFRQVRSLISWARVAANEKDRLALMTAMGTPNVGLEQIAIDRLNEWARDRDKALIDVVRETIESGKANKDGPLCRFYAKFETMQAMDQTNPRFFEELASNIGLDQEAREASPASLEALNQAIAIFGSTFEQLGTLEGVLEAVSISAKSTLEARQGIARVRVDTMHASKGLQFDVVIVSGWEEGNFPRKPKSQKDLEEDRRLAYVTFSRARNMFVATVCRKRSRGAFPPSRFLSEIGINSDMM